MSIADKPLVSIGVPYFNGERFITETLESIKAQTYKSIELLVINDCSTDNSQQIVDDWVKTNSDRFSNVIRLNNPENKGVAYSSRKMQMAANGIYFTKLDADDIILPNKISDQVSFLESNPEIAMVYSNTTRIDSNGVELREDYFSAQRFDCVVNNCGPGGYIFPQLLKEDFIPASSVLVRKSALDSSGGYDESLYIEDWDMWLRISKHHKISFVPGYFSKYRIHDQSMMQKKESLKKVFPSLITALLKHEHMSDEFDKIIGTHLYNYAIGMYRYGIINKYFLKKNLEYNKDFKSLIYYLLALFNIKIHQKKE